VRKQKEKPEHIPIRRPLTFSEALTQIGTLGVKRIGQYVREEHLVELQGAKGRAKYREMSVHTVVRRALMAVKLPMLRVDWTVKGAEGPDAEKATKFLESCRTDMSHTWMEFLDECITGLSDYGAHWFQVLYKRRLGPDQEDGAKRSQYSDGLWGWRKFSPRGHETWDGWEWDEKGDVKGLIQLDPYAIGGTGRATIPIDRSLHFTLGGRMGDPEGESLLRSAYSSWYGLKHAEIWEGILMERMGGVPHFHVADRDVHLFDASDPAMVDLRGYLEDASTAFRLDEQVGVVTPWGIDFKLEAVPVKLEDLDKVIRRKSWEILGSVLAQFLELGQAAHGSYAKTVSDQDFFMLAEEAMLRHSIADVINRFEVPRLFGMNAGSFRLTKLPQLVPGDVQTPNLEGIADPLAKLVQAGALTPEPALEAWLRQLGKLPEQKEAEVAKVEAGEDDQHWTYEDLR